MEMVSTWLYLFAKCEPQEVNFRYAILAVMSASPFLKDKLSRQSGINFCKKKQDLSIKNHLEF